MPSMAADRVGSFASWFEPIHGAVRRQSADLGTMLHTCVGEHSDDDAAAVAQLYVAVRAIFPARRGSMAAAIASSSVVTSGCNLRAVPLLSVMDVLEMLEHCKTFIDEQALNDEPAQCLCDSVLLGAVEEDATRADVRLLLSLLGASNDALCACEQRVLASCSGVGCPVPTDQIATADAPRHAKRIAFDDGPVPTSAAPEVASPIKTKGPRVEAAKTSPTANAVAPDHRPPTFAATATGGRCEESAVDAFLWTPAMPAAIDATYARVLRGAFGADALPPGPFDPQHPQRVMESTPQKLVKRMLKDGASTGFFADLKYDGERLLGFKEVSRSAGASTASAPPPPSSSYRFFSRNMLPVPERKLDQIRALLDAAFGHHSVVFDAEILSMHTFGSMNEVHKGIISLTGPRVFVFDLLWLNGHSLVALPLDARKAILSRVLAPTKNVSMSKCFWIPGSSGTDAERVLQRVFDDAMAKRLEGYVLKPASSLYRFNGTDWVKLKKGYMVGDDGATGIGGTGPSAFSLFPGGPRVRRVDGVAVTTLLHSPRAAERGAGDTSAGRTTPKAPEHALFCKLVDSLDCVVLGTWGDAVLCGVLDPSASTFLTVGYAKDPTHAVRLDPSTLVPFAQGGVRAAGDRVLLSPTLAPPPQYVVSAVDARSTVVEVCAAGLLRDARHSCGDVAMTEDARIVCVRADKDMRCANTKQQVLDMFAYAVPTKAAAPDGGGPTSALSVAVKAFNDQHWVALPSRPGTYGPIVLPAEAVSMATKGLSASAAANSASVTQPDALHVVLLPVAPRKRWVDKGIMKEATAHLGDAPSALCNAAMGIASASSGDVVATVGGAPPGSVLCVVAALVQLVSVGDAPLRPLLDDVAIVDIVLVRMFGALCTLLKAYQRGVVVHVDVARGADEPIWRQAFAAVMGAMPSTIAEKFRCVLHPTCGR